MHHTIACFYSVAGMHPGYEVRLPSLHNPYSLFGYPAGIVRKFKAIPPIWYPAFQFTIPPE